MAPTSATGNKRAAGFSLVELLVVLAVLGLLGGAVLLTAPAAGARVGDQADQLAAHLQRAREEAVLGNRAIALRVDAGGYRFLQRRLEGWTELSASPFQPREFPEGVAVRFPGDRGHARFEFDPLGTATPAALVLSGDGRALRITLDDTGEVAVHAAR
ncbi:MAG: GspH/FimT family protein [Rhizobium sp.]|nr:GspH/FimT family protein [Rhizobium sp.]